MKRNTSIKLKAAFLLIVFALNTVVGFACAIGVDMGFNSKHHQDDEAIEAVVHIHKDGKKHDHYAKKTDHDPKSQHHGHASIDHKSGSGKDDCCNDKVRNFEQLDKSVPGFASIIHPIFFTALIAEFYHIGILLHADVIRDIKPFVRSYHPPIPDIRIAIQSFQV